MVLSTKISNLVPGVLPKLLVSCTVVNTGPVTAAEVAQPHVNIPNGPAKVLRGFGKQGVEPGQKVRFNFDLTRRDLST